MAGLPTPSILPTLPTSSIGSSSVDSSSSPSSSVSSSSSSSSSAPFFSTSSPSSLSSVTPSTSSPPTAAPPTTSVAAPIQSSQPATSTAVVTDLEPEHHGTSTATLVSTIGTDPSASGVTAIQSSAKHPTSFFSNKGAVAGVFTVVGLLGLALLIAIVTNVIRRRRAKKFDDEVANAAAAAYADTDRGPAWAEEDDQWNTAPSAASRAFTNSSGGHTGGSFGAYNGAPMPIPVAGANYGHADEYNMEEFPLRNQEYADNGPNPFGDEGRVRNGSTATAPGIAGVGAALAGQEMRYRGQAVSPGVYDEYGGGGGGSNEGIGYDAGRYPVPPARSRSMNYGHGNGQPVRSPSMSSSGHSHTMIGSSSGPLVTSQDRLPRTQEQADEDPYDGLTPESEHSEPHMAINDYQEPEDVPRVLRVANA